MRTASDIPTIDSVEGYLHRRRRSALPLTPGEAATIAIGVVRGCADSALRTTGGRWRLTAEGRPVLVPDPGADDVLAATARILDDLVSLVPADVRPGFARLRDGVLTEPPRAWDIGERRLLAVVEPQPIVLGPLSPIQTEASAPPRTPHGGPADAVATPFLDRVRRVRSRISAGRGIVLTAVGVGVLVIVVGALSIPANTSSSGADTPTATSVSSWSPRTAVVPRTDESSAGPEQEFPARADPSATDPSMTPPAEPAHAADDVREAALSVLGALTACGDDACTSALREGPADPDEPVPLDPAAANLAVIDDFGGLAVVRLTAGERLQYVTLVRGEDRWLVRSVRDVADQPS